MLSLVVSIAELSIRGTSHNVIAGGVDDVTVNCTASVDPSLVDFGDLKINFTWRNQDGVELRSVDRIIITSYEDQSTLTLSPFNTEDTNFTCSVTVSERFGRLLPSDEESGSASVIVQSK